jgi:hypothetical protein
MAECQEPITECVGLSTDDDVHMFILLGKSTYFQNVLSKMSTQNLNYCCPHSKPLKLVPSLQTVFYTDRTD